MSHLLRYQPFKTLYVAYTVFVVLVVRLPFWFVTALPTSRRPRPSWSIKRVLWVQVIKQVYPSLRKAGLITFHFATHLDVAPGAGGVWVSPVPHLVTGELETWADIAAVSPVRIPGYWLHKKNSTIDIAAPPMPGEKVIYAMHGGGYCECSAHPSDPVAAIARGLLQHCDAVHRVFSIEYRLSAPDPPANPFPAALLDALAGYHYLVDTVGFSSDDIILEGDSAGGNLALALARYLIEHQNIPDLRLPPAPGALLLLSPWVDLGKSHVVDGAANIDIIDNKQASYYRDADTFVGPHGPDASELNRYISPASAHPSMRISFSGFPRTFIVAGGVEALIDQIRTLKDRMVRDLGVEDGVGEGKVTYLEAQDGIHDYLVFPWHEPERTEALEAIAKWVAAT